MNWERCDTVVDCPRCEGVGGRMVEIQTRYGFDERPETCPTCGGGGQVPLTAGLQAALEVIDALRQEHAETLGRAARLAKDLDAARRLLAAHAGDEYADGRAA